MAPGSIFHHINLPTLSYFFCLLFYFAKKYQKYYLIISIRSHFRKWPWRDWQPLYCVGCVTPRDRRFRRLSCFSFSSCVFFCLLYSCMLHCCLPMHMSHVSSPLPSFFLHVVASDIIPSFINVHCFPDASSPCLNPLCQFSAHLKMFWSGSKMCQLWI